MIVDGGSTSKTASARLWLNAGIVFLGTLCMLLFGFRVTTGSIVGFGLLGAGLYGLLVSPPRAKTAHGGHVRAVAGPSAKTAGREAAGITMEEQRIDVRGLHRRRRPNKLLWAERLDRYSKRKKAERQSNPFMRSLDRVCRKIVKWTAVVVGTVALITVAWGSYEAATATPEQRAAWAFERAQRQEERAREQAQRAQAAAEKEEADQHAAREVAAKEVQFRCLSGWTGSMLDFAREVKDSLREPDSFEHVMSSATPVHADGTQIIIMEYRARNGFGGMNVETAQATVNNDDCKLISWQGTR
ncbi:hypothetical protein [Aurantimonas sp. 22II-16-19i]|uniref:hypothetical protein n=1 Tax=Aurantimonas sp. 22II-16-19i TaxID=1317114 RepID=UPI0009F7E2A0|nr:hypothetical protein [Aurantimonas sp. 22II-16-19i]ORE90940.1 hypothetical protein ATO4_19799 [Aurantimonas sp. 22II-16-19i]